MAVMILAAGCTTSGVEEVSMAPGRSGQPADTGSYPNLNIPRQAATAQLTPEETEAKLAQLSALGQRQNPGATGSPEATAAARKRLKVAADEQEETLKVIEGQ